MKDVNVIEPAHELSQAKLELGSFTNRAKLARLQPSQFRAELSSSEFRATSYLNIPRERPKKPNFETRIGPIKIK
ncbi:hypothetical protein Hanom_Chr02g00167341 [Helianthus anomalus]